MFARKGKKGGFNQVESLRVSIFRFFLWQKKMMDMKAAGGITQSDDK